MKIILFISLSLFLLVSLCGAGKYDLKKIYEDDILKMERDYLEFLNSSKLVYLDNYLTKIGIQYLYEKRTPKLIGTLPG